MKKMDEDNGLNKWISHSFSVGEIIDGVKKNG